MNRLARALRPLGPAVLVLMSLLAPCTARTQELSDWSSGAAAFDEAMRSRQDEEMPVVVYFYTDWCGYCKRLNRALADGDIDLSDFLKVRVNPEKGDRERALASRFAVNSYPSVFVIPVRSDRATKVGTYGQWDSETGEAFAQRCREAAGL
jgi:thiol-disulfide isomerase/thioredoxin